MGNNLAYEVNLNIMNKEMKLPLSSYTQTNCQVTLTDEGYRIYRPPNLIRSEVGNNMWGGFIMRFYNPPFEKGHRYIIIFETRGQTSNKPSDFYWTNQAGWGGGGLQPTPDNVIFKNIDANFNSTEWVLLSYAWTINDDVYKTCTSSYSGFKQGTVYPSYRDFKWGFGYTDTGQLGTDLYIKNVRMYDITNPKNIQINKNGIIIADSLWENFSKEYRGFYSSGEIITNQFYEM